MIVRKVWKANKKNQLFLTIPRNQGITEGDYVSITKIEEPVKETVKETIKPVKKQKPIAVIKGETVQEIDSTVDCPHFTLVSRFCNLNRDTCLLISKSERLKCPKRG